MNDIIPIELRILTALFYTIGSIPMVLVLEHVITSQMNIYDFGIGDYIGKHFWQVIAGVSISVLILILILWGVSKEIHPFIDISGRNAINCTLTSILSTLSFGVFLAWYLTHSPWVLEGVLFSWICATCLSIAYFLTFAIAIIFALQGYQYTNFLIYPFV